MDGYDEAKCFMVLGGAIAIVEEVGRLRLICSNPVVADKAKRAIPKLETASSVDGYPTWVLFQGRNATLEEPLEDLEKGDFTIAKG